MASTGHSTGSFKEIKIAVAGGANSQRVDSLENPGDGGSCSEAEPFALQVIDDSMEPEFAAGCVIVIDPSGVLKDGAFVFAKDNKDEYIFRRLRIVEGKYYLEPLNPAYDTIGINAAQVEGIVTQRAGKRRSYHKWYDK